MAKVYQEVKAVRRILEDVSERIILASLPEEELSHEEKAEIEKALKERGEFVPLSELESRYGKKTGRIRGPSSQKGR